MSKINIKRPGTGFIKLEVVHNGSKTIRSNLRSSLLGTSGENQKHIVSVLELMGSVAHPCLSVPEPNSVLFKIFGRTDGALVRVLGAFNDDEMYLGERPIQLANVQQNSENNGGIEFITEDIFSLYVPRVFSVRDFVWIIQKKIRRISEVLLHNGWRAGIGTILNVPGLLANSVGQATYGTTPVVLANEAVEEQKMPEDIVEFQFSASGFCGIQGTADFWNSFGIWCSPYFRQLTGFPELIVRTGNVFGEVGSVEAAPPNLGAWRDGNNTTSGIFMGTKNLFITVEERDAVLITSDIPLPPERNCKNGRGELRYVFAHFDLKGQHDHTTGRNIENLKSTGLWSLEGQNIIGNVLMDSPKHTGFASLVLPSILPSINVRASLRRKQYDFETNEYSTVEVPLLQSQIDQLLLRLNFTLQM